MKKNHFLAAWLRPHLTTLCIRGPRAEEDAGEGRKDDAMITEEMEQAGRDGGAAGRSVLEAMSRFSTRSLPIFPMKTAAAVAVVQRSHRKLVVVAAAAALSEREADREGEERGEGRREGAKDADGERNG